MVRRYIRRLGALEGGMAQLFGREAGRVGRSHPAHLEAVSRTRRLGSTARGRHLALAPPFQRGKRCEWRWRVVRFRQMILATLGCAADSLSPLPESGTPEPAP